MANALFSCDLIICVFARKTLNRGGVKTPKVSYDGEEHKKNSLHKSKDNKPTKKQKLLRGGKPSSSQRRLLACVPRSDVMEEDRKRSYLGSEAADHNIAGSGCGEHTLERSNADQKIDQEKWNYADRRLAANERYVDCRWFSDNAPGRNSFKDSSMTRRRKSESDVDINVESINQKLLEEETLKGNDKKTSEKDKNAMGKGTECETCQRLLNDDKHDRVICTAL